MFQFLFHYIFYMNPTIHEDSFKFKQFMQKEHKDPYSMQNTLSFRLLVQFSLLAIKRNISYSFKSYVLI
jgi:hypothetical protein